MCIYVYICICYVYLCIFMHVFAVFAVSPAPIKEAAFGRPPLWIPLLGLGRQQMQALWAWGRQQIKQKHVYYPLRINKIMSYYISYIFHIYSYAFQGGAPQAKCSQVLRLPTAFEGSEFSPGSRGSRGSRQIPALWWQQLLLGPYLPHVPGARMTVVTQTPSNYLSK